MPGLLLRLALSGSVLAAVLAALPGAVAPASAASCSFQLAPNSPAAFCDTFGAPMGTQGRSGQLNGVVWGVSRVSSGTDPSRGLLDDWASVTRATCGSNQVVAPEHDVAVCGGQAVEAINDNGAFADLAMYPRQPFDFAGRTGTAEFDVSDDTEGQHAAWPAFLITDQPVPAPYSTALGVADHAHDSVGFTLAGTCGQLGCGLNDPPGVGLPGFRCVGVDSMFVTVGYEEHAVPFNTDGCVLPSSGPGSNNHFEVQVSASGMKVYGSDPGRPQTIRLIADASFSVPLTRGLIWLEDVHFDAGAVNNQQSHTFTWANVGFDGPLLPRDLGFDVLDARRPGPAASNGQPTTSLGYLTPHRRDLVLAIRHVVHRSQAIGALLELTYFPQHPQTLIYSVGRHRALRFAWPFGGQPTYVWQTIAVPVPLGDVHNGVNWLHLRTSDPAGVAVANLDLILRGAGGVPPRP